MVTVITIITVIDQSNMATPIATPQAVFSACEALASEGVRPSILLVQQRLGGGSYSTVKRHLDAWLSRDKPETSAGSSISAPESLTRAFGAAGHALWTACIAEAERGVAARLNAQEERLKAMENRIQALEGLLAANHSSRAGALSAQPPFPSRSNAT